MKTQHTPGPWFFDQHGHVYGTLNGQQIEGVPGGKTISHPHVCTPRCIANARLIAAAPELLEALADCVAHMHWTQPKGEAALKKAKAAIAKATGEQA